LRLMQTDGTRQPCTQEVAIRRVGDAHQVIHGLPRLLGAPRRGGAALYVPAKRFRLDPTTCLLRIHRLLRNSGVWILERCRLDQASPRSGDAQWAMSGVRRSIRGPDKNLVVQFVQIKGSSLASTTWQRASQSWPIKPRVGIPQNSQQVRPVDESGGANTGTLGRRRSPPGLRGEAVRYATTAS
jgi:hypothetical protein